MLRKILFTNLRSTWSFPRRIFSCPQVLALRSHLQSRFFVVVLYTNVRTLERFCGISPSGELVSSYSKNYVLEVLDPRLNLYLKISSGILYMNVRMIWKVSAGARASFFQPCRKLNPTGSYSTSI